MYNGFMKTKGSAMKILGQATEQSGDDKAWDEVLSDPENQKTLAELSKAIKEGAAQGVYCDPLAEPKEEKD